MTRYDLLSKKEYAEKMESLQEKHRDIENSLNLKLFDGKAALSPEEVIGVEKRKAMTLAE